MTPWLDHLAVVSVGLVVAALAAIPARRALRNDPSACYRLCLALLLGACALLPLQWIVQGSARELVAPARARFERWLERAPRPPGPRDGSILVEAPRPRAGPRHLQPAQPATLASHPPAAAPAGGGRSAAALGNGWLGASGSPAGALAAGGWRWMGETVREAAGALRGRAGVQLWLLGVALVAAHRALGVARTWRLLRAARPVEDAGLRALWRRVAAGSRVADRVRLLVSDAVSTPACVGGPRPALILPAAIGGPIAEEALEWAMRHELVHLERRDSRAAALQSLATTLLWFHPAAWWLSAEISRLRELSCDQLVVRGSGRRRSYALALLEYAAAMNARIAAIDAGPHSAGARCALLHWSRSPTQIQRRIEMLTVDSTPASRSRRTAGRLLAFGALFLPALGQVGAAATLVPRDGQKAACADAAPAAKAIAPAAAAACDAPTCDDDAKRARARARDLRVKLDALRAAGDDAALRALERALARSARECAAPPCESPPPIAELEIEFGEFDADLDDLEEFDLEEVELAFENEDFDFDLDGMQFAFEGMDFDLEDVDFDIEDVDFDIEDVDFDIEDVDFDIEDVDFDIEDTDFDSGRFVVVAGPQLEFELAKVAEELVGLAGEPGAAQAAAASFKLVGDEVQAIQEQLARAMAQAEKQFAEVRRQAEQARHGAMSGDELRELAARHREIAAKAQEEAREAVRAATERHGARQAELQAHTKARLADLRARQEEQARRAHEKAAKHAARRHETRAPPEPSVPAAPPGKVKPPKAPRAPQPPMPPPARLAPPHLDEHALLDRIRALEAEIAELRAALEASRSRAKPPDAPPVRRTRSAR